MRADANHLLVKKPIEMNIFRHSFMPSNDTAIAAPQFVRRGGRYLFFVLFVLTVAPGCATTPSGPDRIGGIALTMEVRRGEDSIARYGVEADGTLTFAGGKSAILGSAPDWTGSLTDAEAAELRELVMKHDLLEAEFQSSNDPSDLKYTIHVRDRDSGEWGGGLFAGRRIRLIGEHPAITPIEALLAKAAARRNDPVIESLPRPSIETIGK